MGRISILKQFDSFVVRPLVRMLPARRKYHAEKVGSYRSILFVRPGGIGDAVLLLPTIQALKADKPELRIDVLCETRNAGIFSLTDAIHRIYRYDRPADLLQCMGQRYNVVIDTEQWHRLSAVVAHLTRAPVTVGFGTNERKRLFNVAVPYSHEDYEAHSFFRLIEPLLGSPPVFQPDQGFIDPASFPADTEVAQLFRTGKLLFGIFPGASVQERRWGGENFASVARVFLDRGHRVAILGGAVDAKEGAVIREHAPGCLDMTGKTTLRDVAAILKKCAVLVTADSGLLHVAVGVGTSTVSLFGSGIEKKWAPRGREHVVLNRHLACSPCTKFGYTPRCPRHLECLRRITPEEVIAAAENVLSAGAGRS